jgi:1-phosphofructokinase
MSDMIGSICLNPCIDRTVEIEEFTYGGMNRILSSREDGCGKGVNVALVARTLGMDAVCAGFLFAENGESIASRLRAAGAGEDCIWLPGKVRTNLKVFDRKNARITEINEAGAFIGEEGRARMVEKVRALAARCDTMVFTGSLPPGCPPDFYETLLNATAGQCRCVLDAEGEKLTCGMRAHPFLIKPNQYELELRVGRSLGTLSEIKEAAVQCAREGIAIVAVSMGGDGAMITDGEKSYFAPALKVPVRSTVGAGDSMVAGFLHGLSLGEDLAGVFARGVAAGTAAVMTEGTQLLARADYEKLLARVAIEEI